MKVNLLLMPVAAKKFAVFFKILLRAAFLDIASFTFGIDYFGLARVWL